MNVMRSFGGNPDYGVNVDEAYMKQALKGPGGRAYEVTGLPNVLPVSGQAPRGVQIPECHGFKS